MKRKPFLAILSILGGILMIAAGLGYTVNQASLYQLRLQGGPLVKPPDELFIPDNAGAHLPYHPTLDQPEVEVTAWEVQQVMIGEELNKLKESDLFFAALSLLSGAVLASIGAITLIHRWKGISRV